MLLSAGARGLVVASGLVLTFSLWSCTASPARDEAAFAADARAVADAQRLDQAVRAGVAVSAGDVDLLRAIHQQYPAANTVTRLLQAALERREDWPGVIELLGAVPARERSTAESLALGRACFVAGRYEDVEASLAPLLATRPPDMTAVLLSGETLLRLGQFAAGGAVLDDAWNQIVSTGNANGMALRGLLYYSEGHASKAESALQDALRLQPEHVAANNTLARLHAERGEVALAESLLDKVRAAGDRKVADERRARYVVQLVHELQDAWAARNYAAVVERAERLLPSADVSQRPVVYQYLLQAYRALDRGADVARVQAELQALRP